MSAARRDLPLNITMCARVEPAPPYVQDRALAALSRRCTDREDFLVLVDVLGLTEALSPADTPTPTHPAHPPH